MSTRIALSALAIATLGVAIRAGAEDVIAPDQPGLSMSSLTVGNGRFELETSAQRDIQAGVYSAWSTPTLVRFGFADNWEIRASSAYARVDAFGADRASGSTDAALGVKYHVAGSGADGAPSLGVLLNVTLPTGADALRGSGVRPSLLLSNEWTLRDGYSLAAMPGVIYDHSSAGRYVGGVAALSFGKDVGDSTHLFTEIAAPRIADNRDGGTQLSFNTGTTYGLAANTQIDLAAYAGLNDRTPDIVFTLGLSRRW
jgi:hypothetical protein